MKNDIKMGVRGGAVAAALFLCGFLPTVVGAAEFSSYVKTRGLPASSDCFYGSYLGATPGASAFKSLLTTAQNSHKLMLVIYSKSSCGANCDAFELDWFNHAREAPLYVAQTWNGYFRGSDQASLDAKAFLKSMGASGDCHLMGFYGYAQDGKEYKKAYALPSSVASLKTTYDREITSWKTFEAAHRYTPPGVVFRTGTTAGTHFQSMNGAASVSVPIDRVRNSDKAETTSLRVTYPNANVTTNLLDWAAGEAAKYQNIAILGPWEVGKSIKLSLFDATTGKQIGDNAFIDIVKEGNSFSFPDLAFDEDARWGQWTLYSEENWTAAMQKVHAANTYSQPDTNDNATVKNIIMDIPISPSNRYEVVYTDDITFFEDQTSPVSNWFETVEQPYECFGTNRTFYVQLPGSVTNEDVAARVLVPQAGNWATTNFYFYALTNGEHAAASTEVTWTNFEATVAVDCTESYYTVETNEYQYGEAGREEGGRDAKRIQSFVLKVKGSAVWNDETIAFAASVFDSKAFSEWCAANNVVTLLHECADPATGASLFSYAAAANGRSGTAFLSRNGLRESDCEKPSASNVFEVALYRPDGTLGAVLAPQKKDGKYDTAENISRLGELMGVADDVTEPENGLTANAIKAYYGRTVNTDPSAELYTLCVSDKKDMFELCEVPAGKFVTVSAYSSPDSLYNGHEKPAVKVFKWTGGSASPVELAPVGTSLTGDSVWNFSSGDVAHLYAEVTAWTADYAVTETFGGSMFTYPLVVTEAPDFPGEISFVNDANETYDVDSELQIPLKVRRTGYTGQATARVVLETCELPNGSFSWTHGANNTTNLVWKEGEFGDKTIQLTVRNVLWEESVSNLVFTITETTGATLVESKKTCTIGIQQEDNENALTGWISIKPTLGIEPGGTKWVKEGEKIDVVVVRDRVTNPVTGKSEARGEAKATISALGGATVDQDSLIWGKGARVGERTFTATMPSAGKSGERKVVITVVGTDAAEEKISDTATGRIIFMVIPANAPEFQYGGVDGESFKYEVYQYVYFDEKMQLKEYDSSALDVVGVDMISGKLPAGLSATAEADGIRISGTPTGTNSADVVCQLTFRRKTDESLIKTMPVSIRIRGKALGGAGGNAQAANAVIPAFSEKRVWQYLPMTNGESRLAGLLNLTASVKGSVSARYTTSTNTVMFSKASLDDVVPDEEGGGYKAYVRMEKAGHKLNVSFTTDGRVFADIDASGGGEAGFASEAGTTPWALASRGATAWKGRYAVAFPLTGAEGGTAAITINMSSPSMAKIGRATFNGVLPNGKPMNGTTAFVPSVEGAKSVKIPIVWSSASDAFTAMLVATNTGSAVEMALDADVTPYWREQDGELSAVGAQFAADGWAASWAGAGTLWFRCDGEADGAAVALDGKSLKIASKGSGERFSLESIALNRASGMITGTLKIPVGDLGNGKINFRGVALPRRSGSLMKGVAWYTTESGAMPIRRAVAVEIVPENAH